MKVLGIRYCTVSPEAKALANFFKALSMSELKFDGIQSDPDADDFFGSIFSASESWIEVWKPGEGMPAGTMLQIVVDDADAFAAHAKANGLTPDAPMDAHGERIYMIKAPGGLQMSFQSKIG